MSAGDEGSLNIPIAETVGHGSWKVRSVNRCDTHSGSVWFGAGVIVHPADFFWMNRTSTPHISTIHNRVRST